MNYDRQNVLKTIRAEGIPVVDLFERLSQEQNPGSFYLYPGSHFNIAGYRMFGETIIKHLDSYE